jgi:hypothetical protein
VLELPLEMVDVLELNAFMKLVQGNKTAMA